MLKYVCSPKWVIGLARNPKGIYMDAAMLSHYKEKFRLFVEATVFPWMTNGVVKTNSFSIIIGQEVDGCFEQITGFSHTHDGAEHGGEWYESNAEGKGDLCAAAKMDSMLAIHVYPLFALTASDLFPWGGGVYDPVTRSITATSGFREREDIFVSQAVQAWRMLELNMAGMLEVDAARKRGRSRGKQVASDRFTHVATSLT